MKQGIVAHDGTEMKDPYYADFTVSMLIHFIRNERASKKDILQRDTTREILS